MPQTKISLPDFEDPEWNERRIQLQDEIGAVAEKLILHMSAPAGCQGSFEFQMGDGRELSVTIEAGPRPKTQ